MPNPSDPKHSNWNRGEYRTEYLSHENDPEFNRGLLVGENVDLHPTNVIYKRGGFVFEGDPEPGGSPLMSSVPTRRLEYINDASVSPQTSDVTVVTTLVDWHLAELFEEGDETWWGMVAVLSEVGRANVAQGLLALGFLRVLRSQATNKLDQALLNAITLAMNGRTRNYGVGKPTRKSWVSPDNYIPQNYTQREVRAENLAFFRTNKPGTLSAQGARIEKVSERRYMFLPPTGVNAPIYLGERTSGREFDRARTTQDDWFVRPMGATLSGSLYGSIVEAGFLEPERVDAGSLRMNPKQAGNLEQRMINFGELETSDWFARDGSTLKLKGVRYVVGGELPGAVVTPSWTDNGYMDQLRDLTLSDSFHEGLILLHRMEGPEAYLGQFSPGGRKIWIKEDADNASSTETNTSEVVWMRAKASQEFLDKTIQMDGFGGVCLLLLTALRSGQTTKWYLARIARGKGEASMNPAADEGNNCWVGFYFMDRSEVDLEKNANHRDFKFRDLKTFLAIFNGNPVDINSAAFPYWNKNTGNFKHLGRVSGRVCFSNPDAGLVAYSAGGVSTLLTSWIPDQFAIDEDTLIKASESRSGFGLLEHIPRPDVATLDDTAFYTMQGAIVEGREGFFFPYFNRLTLDDDAVPVWVSGQEGAIVGTTAGELAVGELLAGATNYNRFISNRGSSLSLIAKGDSSIFFVGPAARELYQVFFRQQRGGMLTRHITMQGGGFLQEGIKDMKWDFQRKALWVVYGEGKVALYFSDAEYGLAGWVRYGFGESIVAGARSLVRFADKTVGIIRNDNKVYRCPVPYAEGYAKFRDDDGEGGTQSIKSRLKFPLTSMGGSNYTKRNREAILKTSGATRLLFGSDETVRSATGDRGEVLWPLNPYIDDDVTGFRIPSVEVSHVENERVIFMSLGTTVEVNAR